MPVTVRQRSMQHKANVKRSASRRKSSKGDTIITSAPSDLRSITYPGGAVTLGLLLFARLISAYWNHIGDCDETFNYWEPLHYLVYGSGLQTWEYSPVYALRSYASLWVFAVPAKLLSAVMSPISVFYTLRVILSVSTAAAELMFYKAVCQEFGLHLGRMWLFFVLPAAGSFASSSAMLPSSWSSALCTAALACWWKQRYPAAVVLVAVSALLSWPFTALIGAPIALDMLVYKRQYADFCKWSAIALVTILLPMMMVDSWHYGRLVIAPLNIVVYNVFTQHGPTLYGVEPWTYYFVNGLLNFNILWVLALMCPVYYILCVWVDPRTQARACLYGSVERNMLPLVLWLAVFMFQPHKEERFLYPVYSLIVLAGAISLDSCVKLAHAAARAARLLAAHRARHYLAHTAHLFALAGALAASLGVCRITQLHSNYQGTVSILAHLPEGAHGHVCYGKDWYRYPSSFHLPEECRVRFVASEFDGQIPAQYENGTRAIHPYFNDQNKGDTRTYLRPTQCHYLVHSDLGRATDLEPAYHKDNKTWEVVATTPIIDASKSNPYYRAIYVPFLTSKLCVFGNMYLLRNKLL